MKMTARLKQTNPIYRKSSKYDHARFQHQRFQHQYEISSKKCYHNFSGKTKYNRMFYSMGEWVKGILLTAIFYFVHLDKVTFFERKIFTFSNFLKRNNCQFHWKLKKIIEKYTVFFLIWTIFWILTVIKAPISAWIWRMMQLFNHHQWSAWLFSPITTLKRWYHLLTIKHFTKVLTNTFVNSSNNWRFTVFINRNPLFWFFL